MAHLGRMSEDKTADETDWTQNSNKRYTWIAHVQVAYQPPEGVHEGQFLPLAALIEGNLLAVGDDARVDVA